MLFKTNRLTLNAVAVFVAFMFLFSCKKSDDDAFPVDMRMISIKQKVAVRVFTNKVEIKDAKIIAHYASAAVFNEHLNQPVDSEAKFSFLSRDSILMGSSKFTVVQNDKLFLFSSVRSFAVQDAGSGVEVIDILKYNSPKVTLLGGYTRKEVRVGHGNYNEMQLSVLTYMLNKGDRITQWSGESGTLFNEFNEDIVSSLGFQDTLAVQELVLTLRRK